MTNSVEDLEDFIKKILLKLNNSLNSFIFLIRDYQIFSKCLVRSCRRVIEFYNL